MSDKKLVLFGAGKIGRSFIGQLFSRGGYEVVYVDINKPLIEELNRKGRYQVIIKDANETVIWVRNVRGVWASEEVAVVSELRDAGLIAVSVGQSGLPGIIHPLAKGLAERYRHDPHKAVDIIIAENLRNAAGYFEHELTRLLPTNYPFSRLVGLVETSIGKMVPIMQKKDIQEDVLQVFAEAYNTLILDKKAFKNPIPDVAGLAPKENMKAWVDRKLFIHNLGHAAAAYLGNLYNPAFRYIYEALEVPELYKEVEQIMLQSAHALWRKYPEEFTPEALTGHIDDLLTRFGNRSLGDTIFRVGCDLPRKLSPDDRLVGAIRLAREMSVPYDRILYLLVCACHFHATDEEGKILPPDLEFAGIFANGIRNVLTHICGFNIETDPEIFMEAEKACILLTK